MSQHIQFQQVVLHAVIFKMGGDDIGIYRVCRMLYRAKIFHIHIIRNNHQTAGMLPCGTFYTDAA